MKDDDHTYLNPVLQHELNSPNYSFTFSLQGFRHMQQIDSEHDNINMLVTAY